VCTPGRGWVGERGGRRAGPQVTCGALRLKQCAVFADFGRNPADFGPQLAIGVAYGLAARPARRGRCGQHACLFWAALAAGKGVSQAGFSRQNRGIGLFFFIYAPVPGSFQKGLPLQMVLECNVPVRCEGC